MLEAVRSARRWGVEVVRGVWRGEGLEREGRMLEIVAHETTDRRTEQKKRHYPTQIGVILLL